MQKFIFPKIFRIAPIVKVFKFLYTTIQATLFNAQGFIQCTASQNAIANDYTNMLNVEVAIIKFSMYPSQISTV